MNDLIRIRMVPYKYKCIRLLYMNQLRMASLSSLSSKLNSHRCTYYLTNYDYLTKSCSKYCCLLRTNELNHQLLFQFKSNSFSTFNLYNNIKNYNYYKFNCDLIRKSFHTNSFLYDKDSSKVETTVKALREEVEKKDKSQTSGKSQSVESVLKTQVEQVKSDVIDQSRVIEEVKREVEKEKPKRSLAKKIWDELVHYYHGFRLLIIDIRISSRLIWKILNGGDLTRREHKQLVRTASDVFRIVPFSVFIIVPFMEFLLPVFIKFFPGLLPSTFQTESDKESKIKKELKLKIEMAKFLQNTLDEMTLKAKGESHSHTAKEFAQFFEKVRKSGQQVTNEEIMKFSKIFEDEITLDSLSRPQLVALCRLLELQPFGTNNFLRFQLRMQLRSLKADDQVIQNEGIDALTVPELQQACRARGMRALGVSEQRLKSQLAQWLELSLNEHIPQSLLLLSRVLYLPENLPAKDQLAATIQALPEDILTEAKYKIGETEGKIDNKTKIELLKKEEVAIKKEKEEEIIAKAKLVREVDELLDKTEVLIDKAVDIEKQGKQVKEIDKEKEQLSKEDIESLEDALENIAKEKHKLLLEKEELEELKEEMADYKEDIKEFKELAVKTGYKNLKETKAAKRLSNKVDKMINKMDILLNNLGFKRQDLQQKLDIKAQEGKDIQKERDDVIGINDLLLAIRRLQKIGDDTKLQRIVDVLDMMDIDHDGQVEIEHVIKVIELLGRENVKVTPNQMKDIINLLIIEEKLEEEEKKRKQELEKQKDASVDSKDSTSKSN